MVLKLAPSLQPPLSVCGTIHLETQWFMRNIPQWKMYDDLRYNAFPGSLSIREEA